MIGEMDAQKQVPMEMSQTIMPQVPSRKASIQIVFEDSLDDSSKLIEYQSEDYAHSTFEFERLKVAEISCCLLATLGFCCSALGYDLEYSDLLFSQQRAQTEIVMISGTASTALLLIAICWRTVRELRWLQAKCFVSQHDDLFTTQKVNWLVVEIGANVLHPVHWMLGAQFEYYNSVEDVTIRYTYNSWLSVWMLIRVYHLVKVVSILSPYRSGRAQRVCRMNGTYPGSWFAVKCLMKELPYQVLAAVLMAGMFMGAYMLRIFERPMAPHTHMDYGQYGNAMWNVVVTMTTAGYGDYYPVTLLGRISGIIVCFWGVLSVSMIIVTISALLNLDSSEEKALLILNRLAFKQEIKSSAASLITSALHYRYLVKKHPTNFFRIDLQLGKFRKSLDEFQRIRNKQVSLYALDSYNERIEKRIVSIEDSVSELKQEIESVKAIMSHALGL